MLGSAVAAGLVTSGTFAAWSAKTNTPGNSIKAATDWLGPTVSAVVASKGTGTDGYVRPGGTYRVYATVADDTGSPPSGLGTITANLTTLGGTATTAVTAGSTTLNGVTYSHRTASITLGAGVTEGAKAFTLTAKDAANNQTLRSNIAVTVDGTAPATTDVQTANKTGGTAGRPEVGDTVTYTFSEHIEPSTILTGWNGGSLSVTGRLNNVAGGDTFTLFDSANTTQAKLGTIKLPGASYTTANRTFTGSTMTMSASSPWTVTITLGTASGAVATDATSGAMAWTPLTGITDLAGNALPTTTRNETGTADREF